MFLYLETVPAQYSAIRVAPVFPSKSGDRRGEEEGRRGRKTFSFSYPTYLGKIKADVSSVSPSQSAPTKGSRSKSQLLKTRYGG